MWDAIWSSFSHPATIFGRDGAGYAAVMAVFVAVITAAFMQAIGRLIMRRSLSLAVIAGCVFLPFLMNALAPISASEAPKGTDGAGILVFATIVLSICALPVTLLTSLSYVLLRRKRRHG